MAMPRQTPCLIFDLDGTLVDSEPLCSQAFLDLLPDLQTTTAELMHRYRGHRMADVYEDLARWSGRPLPADFETQYRDRVAALYDAHLVPAWWWWTARRACSPPRRRECRPYTFATKGCTSRAAACIRHFSELQAVPGTIAGAP